MRIILVLLFWSILSNSFGQSTATVILDEDYNSLPYCVAVCNNEYVYPDNDSEFDLSPYDSCVITNLGYQSLIWRKSDNDNDTLVMKKLEIMMDEVVIRPVSLKKEKRLGASDKGLFSGLSHIKVPPIDGSAIVYLPSEGRNGIITSMWANLKDIKPNLTFKLCVFSWNPEHVMTNENLLHCVLVDDKEILSDIDISKEQIELPNNGVFLSLTWNHSNELKNYLKDDSSVPIFLLETSIKRKNEKFISNYYLHYNNTKINTLAVDSTESIDSPAIELGIKYREYQE